MSRGTRKGSSLLTLGALGVVFGDIGTSPLYAFSEIFAGAHDIAVTDERVLGALSLVFWTLTLIVSVKYVLIVMRAGKVVEKGPAAEVFAAPKADYTKALIAAAFNLEAVEIGGIRQ